MSTNAGARFRRALKEESRCRSSARSTRTTRCSPSAPATGDLPVRRRRRGRLARHARPRHHQPGRRADRRPPHHRRVRPAAAGGRRHRLRRSAFNIARTVKSLIKFGAAAMHIEDQVGAKRCGHRPGKEIVSHRRRWSTASRPRSTRKTDRDFCHHGAHRCAGGRRSRRGDRARGRLRRGRRRHDLPRSDHRSRDVPTFADAVKVPVLANITEFGKTPLFTRRRTARARASRWCCIRCRPSAP